MCVVNNLFSSWEFAWESSLKDWDIQAVNEWLFSEAELQLLFKLGFEHRPDAPLDAANHHHVPHPVERPKSLDLDVYTSWGDKCQIWGKEHWNATVWNFFMNSKFSNFLQNDANLLKGIFVVLCVYLPFKIISESTTDLTCSSLTLHITDCTRIRQEPWTSFLFHL